MSKEINCDNKPSYEELKGANTKLINDIQKQYEINIALTESLRLIHNDKINEACRANYAERHCDEENKRANKLFDMIYEIRQVIEDGELDTLKKINKINVILGEEDK